MPRETFLRSIDTAASVIGHARTKAAWDDESALAEYTVGGLAGHLARAAITVDRYLDEPAPPAEDSLLDAAEYFIDAMGVDDPITSEVHRQVRHRGEQAGSIGPEALTAEIEATRARLAQRLTSEPDTRCLRVFGGRAMGLNCYLETRIVELVVHTDDLAASVGIDSPDYDAAALRTTRRVLSEIAARRNGDIALIRMHARSERATQDVTAF